jgi:hypothetical protein
MKIIDSIMQTFIGDICGLDDLHCIVDGMINWVHLMMNGIPCLQKVMRCKDIPWHLILKYGRVDRSFILEHCSKFNYPAIFPLEKICAIDDEIFDKLRKECKRPICSDGMNVTVSVHKLIDYAQSIAQSLVIERELTSDEIDYVIKASDIPGTLQSMIMHQKLSTKQLQMIIEKTNTDRLLYHDVLSWINWTYGKVTNM